MSDVNKYRLAVGETQQRLDELSKGDASDLRDEIALCRLLLESATNQQSPAAISLLQTLGKLSTADLQNRLRSRDLLERDEAMQIGRMLCSIVGEEIKVLTGYENVLLRIAERIEQTMKQPRLECKNDC